MVASWQFFWAPTFKWGISIANISDMKKPTEQIRVPQQLAVACTGLIWMRYSLVITPVNYNLFSVRGTTHGQTALARLGARSGRCMYAALNKRHLPGHCLSGPTSIQVNAAMATTGLYQLWRKVSAEGQPAALPASS